MKSIYTILLFFISGYSLYTSPNLDTAEVKSQNLTVLKTMRVITDGGKLLLREEPSTNSKIILKIDNGDYVDALEIKPEFVTINKKTGNWIKIIFDDKVGWAFGAYLRDLRKANINTITECPKGGIGPGIEEYLEKEFGKIGNSLPHKNPSTGESIKNSENIVAYNQKYKGDILLSYFGQFGQGDIAVVFKNRTLKDVFQRFQLCDSRFQTDKDLSVTNSLYFNFIDNDEPDVIVVESFLFYKKGKDTIVSHSWSD